MEQEGSLRNILLRGGDSLRVPKCTFCKHFYDNDEMAIICKAFPEGISEEALWERDVEKECNNGIKFEE